MAYRDRQHEANARERVRHAIRSRLDALGMTGRAFGRAFSANEGKGHVDTWVSGLLSGQFALSLDELDEAAYILKVTPAQLVKSDFETAEYLTPTEHRITEAVRRLPPSIRDHLLLLSEYLVGVLPDEIDYLVDLRELRTEARERLTQIARGFRVAQDYEPPLTLLPGQPEKGARPTDAEHQRHQRPRRRKTGR